MLRNNVIVEVFQRTSHNQIPLDFTYLDLRFLPSFLMSERVHIDWGYNIDREWVVEPNLKTFYVGINFVNGYHNIKEMLSHDMEFERLRAKNTKRGYIMESANIKEITPLGIHNPLINPSLSLDQIINFNFSIFKSLYVNYPNWENHQPFIEAVETFFDQSWSSLMENIEEDFLRENNISLMNDLSNTSNTVFMSSIHNS